MTQSIELPHVSLLGRAESSGATRANFSESVRSTIRFADPSAWTLASAVAQVGGPIAAYADGVGLVLVADSCPQEATRAVIERMRAGAVSPMHFLAASASSATGVACVANGLRGPTLNLTVPLAEGLPVAYSVARDWVEGGLARYMVLASLANEPERGPVARSILIGPRGANPSAETVSLPHAVRLLSSPGMKSPSPPSL